MNLICPHCQKQVSVADTLAGLTTNCPQCQGPFTVPIPPSAPLPPSPPPLSGPAAYAPSPSTIPLREEPAAHPPPPRFEVPPPSPSPSLQPIPGYEPPPPSVETGDYRYRSTLYFRPQVIKWIAPVCFFLIFLLMFFPWVGAYAGSIALVRQSGLGLAFGGYSEFRKDYFKEEIWGQMANPGGKASEEKPPSLFAALTLFYFLVVLLGILAAIAFLVLPNLNPEIAGQFAPWRSLAIGGLSILALLFLLLQLLIGFPLENKVVERADKSISKLLSDAKQAPEAERRRLTESLELQKENVRGAFENRPALRLVLLLNLVAVIASLIDFWLERRVGRPAPRLVVES